jgi:hypothetical protein
MNDRYWRTTDVASDHIPASIYHGKEGPLLTQSGHWLHGGQRILKEEPSLSESDTQEYKPSRKIEKKMKLRLLLSVLVVFSFPTLALAANDRAEVASPELVVPSGWSIWEIRKGDLTNDGQNDAVVVMQHGNESGEFRVAALVANSTGGFDLVADNSKLLTYRPEVGLAYALNSENFSIRDGAFSIQMMREGKGGAASVTFTFKRMEGDFVLVGYDYDGEHVGWMHNSVNLLTGDFIATEGASFAGHGRSIERRAVSKFQVPEPIPFHSLGPAFEFDTSFVGAGK